MSDETAFLNALRENPGDDTTRLVYADWLDERSDPRAEFIRLRQQHAQLTARINELAGQFDPAWLAAVGGPLMKPEDITLRSGRSLWLRELRQWDFYECLWQGHPESEWNREHVEETVVEERERWGMGKEPYLIRPEERPVQPPEGGWQGYGPCGYLPRIASVGRFESHFKAPNEWDEFGSELVVIWFQQEFAFPIDPVVREQIRAIDWEKHAWVNDNP